MLIENIKARKVNKIKCFSRSILVNIIYIKKGKRDGNNPCKNNDFFEKPNL